MKNRGSSLARALRNPGPAWRFVKGLARGGYYRAKFRILGRRVIIGRRFRVSGPLDIKGPGTVIFGDDCRVLSKRFAPTTPYTHSPEAVIRFGNGVQLTRTRLGCQSRIDVGDGAGLADARIMDTDFHAVEFGDTPRYDTKGIAKPIEIGANAWICAEAIVLKGSRIGENSIVGAGAVVAQVVPANTVVMGNPARVVWRLNGWKSPAKPAELAVTSWS